MAIVWRKPIFDRTEEDVDFAIRKISEWKKSHTHSTDIIVENDTMVVRDNGSAYVADDKLMFQSEGTARIEDDVLIVHVGDVYDLKGCLNLSDITRIEDNITYLAEKMESYTYSPSIYGKQWNKSDMPNENDISRIVENIRALIIAFYSPDNPPSLPSSMLSYRDINAIEENLYLIKQLLDNMENSFGKVGTIKSGATTFLPLRR